MKFILTFYIDIVIVNYDIWGIICIRIWKSITFLTLKCIWKSLRKKCLFGLFLILTLKSDVKQLETSF